ncbi:MAG: ImmA/IrrE family metallo-endopeptidase [Coriobacteriia bacterium]|nr:ImmA/IrrE family metallo-endopeptidase [Coriobacteriia bacterium]
MSLHTDAYYRLLAEDVIKKAGIEEPPVPIDDITRFLGVPVLSLELPLWFTAALIYEDGMPSVLVNTTKEPDTQRAGLGHVLGHLLVLMADVSENYPKGSTYEHHEADIIADELEIPEFMVRDQAKKWFNDYRYLARLFGVTEKRMLERMQQMGIIKNRGIIWDY